MKRLSLGYTLIELLSVLAILAVLLTAALPLAELTAQREREHDLKRALWEIRDAIDAYKHMADLGAIQGSTNGFPLNLESLVNGVIDQRTGQKIYFLRRIPSDPFAEDSSLSPDQEWGLRSYQSPPDQPQAGVDVYDIFSKSKVIALDGTPINKW